MYGWRDVKQGEWVKADSEFVDRLNRLISRVEAWSYGDSDAGSGLPQELAKSLKQLASRAPAGSLREGLRRAQDALDDGLSAEMIAAALYRVRTELLTGPQPSLPVSPPVSRPGVSGRLSPKRGRSPNRGRSP